MIVPPFSQRIYISLRMNTLCESVQISPWNKEAEKPIQNFYGQTLCLVSNCYGKVHNSFMKTKGFRIFIIFLVASPPKKDGNIVASYPFASMLFWKSYLKYSSHLATSALLHIQMIRYDVLSHFGECYY